MYISDIIFCRGHSVLFVTQSLSIHFCFKYLHVHVCSHQSVCVPLSERDKQYSMYIRFILIALLLTIPGPLIEFYHAL